MRRSAAQRSGRWRLGRTRPSGSLRGGTPPAYGRVIATRHGIEAIDAMHEGNFGGIVRGADAVRMPLDKAVETVVTVDRTPIERAAVFFG